MTSPAKCKKCGRDLKQPDLFTKQDYCSVKCEFDHAYRRTFEDKELERGAD